MTKKNPNKYLVSGEEHEVLPNKLGLTDLKDVGREEFKGFILAQEHFIDQLGDNSRFNLKYLHDIHKRALGHLYSFAGKLRTVNMSKGGFIFPSALFLPTAMDDFEKEMLPPFSAKYKDEKQFVKDLSAMHAELVYLHPFREGNGRTIRLFTNLIALKHYGVEIDFPWIMENKGEDYIKAVQQATSKEYSLMERLISEAFKL